MTMTVISKSSSQHISEVKTQVVTRLPPLSEDRSSLTNNHRAKLFGNMIGMACPISIVSQIIIVVGTLSMAVEL